MTPAGAAPAGIRAPDYRLPDASRVGRVRLQVSDLDRSLRFYEGLLGFRVLARSARHALLGPRHGDAELVELHAPPGVRSAPAIGRLGLYHFAILLPDRAALGRILARLGERGVSPGMADHAVSEALYLNDPDGLGIEIYADRPRGEWARRGRELLMVTEPLDVESVLREGGGDPWHGMPEGTTIGHVHLHVGDLEGASAFYHAALGLDRMVWSYRGALFLAAGGYHHHLGLNTWAGPRATAPDENEARLLDWEILLPEGEELPAVASSLEKAGFDVGIGKGDVLETRDPWGTGLRIRVGAKE
ncbi:MAG TPA: VOC family protein [Gemmatimonadaceae bacterium]|nr:VOC family protein [Gemmatimonadaceae bacterium]